MEGGKTRFAVLNSESDPDADYHTEAGPCCGMSAGILAKRCRATVVSSFWAAKWQHPRVM